MSLQTELCVGAYMIYDDPADDERIKSWSLEPMRQLEPYTVAKAWGDSDQTYREVRVLTD